MLQLWLKQYCKDYKNAQAGEEAIPFIHFLCEYMFQALWQVLEWYDNKTTLMVL